MKKDIVLAGVGGQGILSIAAIIGIAAVNSNLYLKQAEVHGMSQRGGDVQSNLRLSDKEIASDLIPFGKADIILSVEPMEALRYLPMLAPDGWLITNTNPFNNIPDYPDMDKLLNKIKSLPYNVAINADQIAKDAGSVRTMNIVMLGAASPFLNIDYNILENTIKDFFAKKGDKIIEMNLKALKAGRDFVDNK
ncbi:MAG: indolepyruvate oxidoreductase subunit beta [Bacteroidales bacterium]|nr:indolepyruvate oxidoreductase subunit beta [Bacteroidales bacterium]